MTGTLHVMGRPGGVFHCREGLVVAVRTPGAPGPETLLMRSGRIASAGTEAPEAGTRVIGAAEFEVVRVVSAYDSAFAIMVGTVDDCVLRTGGETEPAGRGEEPERLVREALRRVDALRALPDAVLPHDDRMAVAAGADRETGGGLPIRREILLLADGRRTCRDIAYATAHGVYAVAVEVSRMLEAGLLERAEPQEPEEGAPAKPILARAPEPVVKAAVGPPRSLPRRTPGGNEPSSARPERRAKDWADFARLRDPAG
ncbi:MarR family transcriptional regulator [Actinocorallia populi]|uniref:MarR family transcriptional regulator n=1 Tax=Actinocorallia populi TaxID=2079200 RepID=UPI000D095B1F|nr:MarR family transcriptional regulator [Actinocorallia populi]